MTGANAAGRHAGPPGMRRVERGAPDWPPGLEHLGDPPAVLWVAGRGTPVVPAVAVVGARRCSMVGLRVARDLGRHLARAGVQVVSGMALGIDGAAHQGALDLAGSTVAVLGCGLDRCYPSAHRGLRDAICATGAVVSEEAPGTPPEPWRFPRRNRLIAAMSVAVVVVEAGERSGALSTARQAADLGREVLAVPGTPTSAVSRGTNLLIRDGATPVVDADDVLRAVPALPHLAGPGTVAWAPRDHDRRRTRAARVLELAAGGPTHPDDIAVHLGVPASEVARLLTSLELAGHLLQEPGGLVQSLPRASDRQGWVQDSP